MVKGLVQYALLDDHTLRLVQLRNLAGEKEVEELGGLITVPLDTSSGVIHSLEDFWRRFSGEPGPELSC